MRLAHCADLHLGFRSFERVNPDGANVRERDVLTTFAALVDALIAQQPDVIVIGGDVVHTPRPTNRTILALLAGFTKLTSKLPGVPILLAAGNHDLARAQESADILDALKPLGVIVAGRESLRITLHTGLSCLLVPDAPGVRRPELTPDASAKHNVLLLHGEMQGMPRLGGDRSHEIGHDEAHLGEWHYAALGHYHVMHAIAPNCYYSGSIDFSSSDPWGELRSGVPKGFIIRDLESGVHGFHPLPVSRVYQDLQPIDALSMTPAELDTAIGERVGAQSIEGTVTRLVVNNCEKETGRAIDHMAVKAWKRSALHFQLDLRRPDRLARSASPVVRSRGISLAELVARKLSERVQNADIPRDQIEARAMTYLEQAGDVPMSEPTPIEVAA